MTAGPRASASGERHSIAREIEANRPRRLAARFTKARPQMRRAMLLSASAFDWAGNWDYPLLSIIRDLKSLSRQSSVGFEAVHSQCDRRQKEMGTICIAAISRRLTGSVAVSQLIPRNSMCRRPLTR